MPARLRVLRLEQLRPVLERLDAAAELGAPASPDDVRAAVKHFLAELSRRSPGRSVEIRVPPYAAAQCIQGVRHTRGTPPAVVEMDAETWLAVARGELDFRSARDAGLIKASGERSDLSEHLPLT